MRVERPAASTNAATLRRRMQRLFARLRPRDDLHQQPADAHAGDVLARHRQARPKAASAPSRSRSPSGCARSRARRAPDGRRHCRSAADCRDRPACRNARCAPPTASTAAGMTSRRSAIAEAPNTMTSSAPCLSTSSMRARQRALLVRHAPLGDDRGAGGREPLGRDPQRLVDHLAARGRAAASRRRRPCGCGRARRGPAAARAAASALSRAAAATANGMILTVAIISPATTGLKAGSVANVIASIDAVEPVDRRPCRRPARRRFRRTDWRGR